MCGIAAVVGRGSSVLPEEHYGAFMAPLKFRGPDDRGVWHHRHEDLYASLFHTRLAIIDLQATGHQPMVSRSQKTSIVFNGEIYNYQALRKELIEAGHSFFSTSDTEILLNGYEYWGLEKLLQKIDGMFAFLIYDVTAHVAYAVRDRFGKKPLYYCLHQQSLIVSSDIRSFYQIPTLHLTLDLHSLGYFFYEFSTPRADSIWLQIKKVPSAHYGKFTASGFSLHEYWRLRHTESNTLPWSETVERVEFLLREAVKKRLVADVPVAAQLSGGVDSSLVVAMMAQNQDKPVKTYNVRFDDSSIDESNYARLVAERFGTDHTEVNASEMSAGIIDDVILEFGEPFADTSMLPTFQVCREISRTEKVVCGGDGGDELFGGYSINHFTNKLDTIKKFRWMNGLMQRWGTRLQSYRINLLRELMTAANRPDFELLHRNMGFDAGAVQELFKEEVIQEAVYTEHAKVWSDFAQVSSRHSINMLSAFLHTRLENDYLVKVDRASMFASLEMRSPFLDADLAGFAATLTAGNLFSASGTKSVLKAIAEKYFPKEFVHRRKQGFGVPMKTWMRGSLRDRFEEVVFDGKQTLLPFNYSYAMNIFKKHLQGEDHSEKLWIVYVFHRWAQQLAVKESREA